MPKLKRVILYRDPLAHGDMIRDNAPTALEFYADASKDGDYLNLHFGKVVLSICFPMTFDTDAYFDGWLFDRFEIEDAE